jgi:hypothetical protein
MMGCRLAEDGRFAVLSLDRRALVGRPSGVSSCGGVGGVGMLTFM